MFLISTFINKPDFHENNSRLHSNCQIIIVFDRVQRTVHVVN